MKHDLRKTKRVLFGVLIGALISAAIIWGEDVYSKEGVAGLIGAVVTFLIVGFLVIPPLSLGYEAVYTKWSSIRRTFGRAREIFSPARLIALLALGAVVTSVLWMSFSCYCSNPVRIQINKLRGGDHQAARELSKMGEPAVASLIACLNDTQWRVQELAAEALTQLGEPAVLPMIACLKDEQSDVRKHAIQVLGKLGDKRAVEPLIACLKDKQSDVRKPATQVLINLGDVRAVEPLIAYLKDEQLEVRQCAAEVLGNLADARAVEPLIACLKDEQSEVKETAATALGELGDARAIGPLIIFLKRPLEYKDGYGQPMLNALAKLGKPAVTPLISCLSDQTSCSVEDRFTGRKRELFVRGRAAEVLGNLGEAQAIQPLRKALPDWEVNGELVHALVKLGWRPTSDTERVYQWIGDKNDKTLKAEWATTQHVLLEDVKLGNSRSIENAIYTFVSLGREDAMSELILILNERGNKSMAETYLNCGHDGLRRAAESWCTRNRYKISTGDGSHKASWGRW